ncbi:MAG: hypothetical protein HYX63_23330 [Gammaproteobacteria bacterium]|nr:hypothetical protein [Gammaproteobacteria bacterium]
MRFTSLHIDVARHATDDFNPFHDKHKWRQIAGNPFPGPIVLGFQLTAFAAYAVRARRAQEPAIDLSTFKFSQLRVTFANAVCVDSDVTANINSTHRDRATGILSNRLRLRAEQGLVLTGHARLHTAAPQVGRGFAGRPRTLNGITDRSVVPGTEFFLKRKFMTTANAKNFLIGSGVDPLHYIDELEDRVHFPELYPVSLISCALLERGKLRNYDFIAAPMVYTYHDITTDLDVLARLKSNDAVNILVSAEHASPIFGAESSLRRGQQTHYCLGFTGQGEQLFGGEIGLVPLAALARLGEG